MALIVAGGHLVAEMVVEGPAIAALKVVVVTVVLPWSVGKFATFAPHPLLDIYLHPLSCFSTWANLGMRDVQINICCTWGKGSKDGVSYVVYVVHS